MVIFIAKTSSENENMNFKLLRDSWDSRIHGLFFHNELEEVSQRVGGKLANVIAP